MHQYAVCKISQSWLRSQVLQCVTTFLTILRATFWYQDLCENQYNSNSLHYRSNSAELLQKINLVSVLQNHNNIYHSPVNLNLTKSFSIQTQSKTSETDFHPNMVSFSCSEADETNVYLDWDIRNIFRSRGKKKVDYANRGICTNTSYLVTKWELWSIFPNYIRALTSRFVCYILRKLMRFVPSNP